MKDKQRSTSQVEDKHTPGPWKTDDEFIYDDSGRSIAYVETYHSGKLPYQANARLIAAAPEMKEELKECRKVLKHLTFYYENALGERIQTLETRLVNIELLLAKIKGEQ